MPKAEGAQAAPTGCFKCGRPGHWSRDCPSSSATNTNPNPNSGAKPNSTNYSKQSSAGNSIPAAKKVPRSRPKLTQDLLLSDDGLGYVLRHFPRAFKYRGRGHEVDDLGNLIGMYAEWHSHLIPYYSFDQFIRKVEQVGASRRVRRCVHELRERVARGGDPTKLHEPPPFELVDPNEEPEQRNEEPAHMEEPVADMEDRPLEAPALDQIQEEMINEIYLNATDDSGTPQQKSSETSQASRMPDSEPRESKKIEITEEQRARMEANRLKAFERAKQARSSQAS